MADQPQQGQPSAPKSNALPPPPPLRSAAAPAPQTKIAAQHMGFDPLRPFRYAGAFVWGTIRDGLDGMAKGGRNGLKLGILAGIALVYLPIFMGGAAIGILGAGGAFSVGLLAQNAIVGGLLGFGGGAALSGSLGLISGGVRGVGRSYRREKYADDLAVKQESQVARRGHYFDYDDRHAQHRRAASYNFDRLMQQDQRTEQDVRTYWQDRVSGSGQSNGRGF